ncbi:pyruvate ferredoxin oxidoreductase [candidate division WOR-3 bacterium]|nr:pyruvate ferredoxin oxidoreductase [candidate division WOR-3 bacterium]
MASLKQLSAEKDLFASGHRACAGCAASIILRQVALVAGKNTVFVGATGCMEVVSTIFPYTSWKVPFLHNAFENSAATGSGIEATYRSLKKRGKITKKINVISFGGDGGTYDIGFQSLSGAMERRHDMLYLCYNNEAYMNTGIQRSSATPFGAHTTTSPAGTVIPGKQQFPKDLTEAIAAHDIPYVAQAAPHNWADFTKKVEKALTIEGPAFINILSPCPLGWVYPPHLSIKISKLAAETCFWPIYEVENGIHKINFKPKEKKPLLEWIKSQGRFRHLLSEKNKHIVEEAQKEVNRKWDRLLKMAEAKI